MHEMRLGVDFRKGEVWIEQKAIDSDQFDAEMQILLSAQKEIQEHLLVSISLIRMLEKQRFLITYERAIPPSGREYFGPLVLDDGDRKSHTALSDDKLQELVSKYLLRELVGLPDLVDLE